MSRNEHIYGHHAVTAVLKSQPQRIVALWLQQGRDDARQQKLLALAGKQGVTVQRLDRAKLDNMVDGVHQGVIAECRPGDVPDENLLFTLVDRFGKDTFLLVLDGVTDPHNLGACLRSAEAAGVQAVVIPRDQTAGLTPVARKVASGAAEILPLVVVTNLARTLRQLQEKGVWLVGAAGEAETAVFDCSLTGPLALVLGAEGGGLRRLTRETCDTLACIPMAGQVESLNVSVAAGVFLFEALRQRKTGKRQKT